MASILVEEFDERACLMKSIPRTGVALGEINVDDAVRQERG